MTSFGESVVTTEGPLPARQVVDLRQFGSHHLQELLEEEKRFWAEELQWDFNQISTLIGSCLDARRLTGYVLLEDSTPLGYSFFVYEGSKAIIGNVFARLRADRAEIARLLLRHVIETLQGTPGIDRIEAQLPHFSLEEIFPSFEPNGFRAFGRQFMMHDLGSASSESVGLDGEIRFQGWEEKEESVMAALIHEAYRGHVDSEINLQYRSRRGALQVIENVTRHRGCGVFEPGDSLVAVHAPSGVCCGGMLVTSVGTSGSHIPQICVLPEFQGRRIGTALLYACFEKLRSRGHRQVSLTVTDENSDAIRLYERLGFRTYRRFGAFVWHADK